MKKSVFLLVSGVMANSLFAAFDPKEEVRAAIARLAEKPNYSWTATMKNNTPQTSEPNAEEGQGRGRFRQLQQGPIEAKTVRAGITQLTSKTDDGSVVQVATKDDKAIMKTKEGWKPLEDIFGGFRRRGGTPGDQGPGGGQASGVQRGQRGQPAGGVGQGDAANASGGPGDAVGDQGQRIRRFRAEAGGAGGDASGGGRGGFGGGPGAFGQIDPAAFSAMRLRSRRAPTVEAQELLDRVKDLKVVGAGYFIGDLPEAGLRDLIGGRRGGVRGGGREGQDNQNPFQPRTEGTKATAKFWTTGGVLNRFETSIQTKIIAPPGAGGDFTIDLTNTTEIRQVGTTRLDLPKEAFALLLGQTATSPAPAARPAQRSPAPAPPAQGTAPQQN